LADPTLRLVYIMHVMFTVSNRTWHSNRGSLIGEQSSRWRERGRGGDYMFWVYVVIRQPVCVNTHNIMTHGIEKE
jgi:hypothetical protein